MIPIIEFMGSPFHGFTGLRTGGSRDHRGCAFSAFVFCSFPASGREGPGSGRTSPRGPGFGRVVRMSGPGGSEHGPGRMDPRVLRRPNRGSEMNNKPLFVRFSSQGSGQPLSRQLVLHTPPLARPSEPARSDKPSQDICGLVGAQT